MVIPGHVDFEGRARLHANFVERMVDPATSQPYFTIFDHAPPQAVHDWPDFGDLTARFLESALMVEVMTGYRPATTDRLGELLLGYFDGGNGLNYRPQTSYSQHVAELFDQSRTLNTLCSWVMAGGDERVHAALRNMVDGLREISLTDEDGRYYAGTKYSPTGWVEDVSRSVSRSGYFVGPLIRPLVRAAQLLDYEPPLELAVDLARRIVKRREVFGEDGSFDGHVHSRLASASGLMAAGLASGNQQWCELAYRAWQFARQISLRFGFVPEWADDSQARLTCETCCLMDYLDLMLLLARNGYEQLWSEIDRTVRNHLIESQFTSAQWGRNGHPAPRTDLILEDSVAERLIGGFAGWSSPDYMFGYTPYFGTDWLRPTADPAIYLNKPRVAMNCCGPSGLKALYLVWSQCVESVPGGWVVHLPLNRWSDGLKVTAPFPDQLVIQPERDGSLAVRIPIGARVRRAEADDLPADHQILDNYLQWPYVTAGSRIEIHFSVQDETTEEILSHPGLPEEIFQVQWHGPAVTEVVSILGGPSDAQSRQLTTLHHVMPLYQQRADGLSTAEPQPAQPRSARIVW